ncbi:MAG: glycine cleavage T C-terminal barrel domain-containing protein [Verrucomicrobiota bacterium]
MPSLLLHDFHQAAGAAFLDVNSQQAVATYGDWQAEHAALHAAAGVLDLSFRSRLCLLGADALRFLNGQVTNNVKDLNIGQGCYAALLSAKGKLQSDLNIYRLQNELLLDFEPGFSSAVTQRLEEFVIADDVQIVDAAPHYGLWSVQGPKAAALLASVLPRTSLPQKPMAVSIVPDAAFGEIYIANHPRLGTHGFDLFVPLPAMNAFAALWAPAAAPLCGWQALETARVEAAIPRFGADMDETNLASEALDTRAISYSKGCYIGQEVIARVRTYGQVAKTLRQLRLPADLQELPPSGAKLFLGQKQAGYITTAVRSPLFQSIIALAYVRREADHPGADLALETPAGKISAQIIPLA